MSDKPQRRFPPYHVPALAPRAAPRPSLPALPSSSGAFWGSPTTIMRKDTEFVRRHTEYLQARTAQSGAMRELVESRLALATTMAKLAALPEIAAHEYELGRRDRAHELQLRDLKQQTEIVSAQVLLAEAQQVLAAYRPAAPAASPTAAPSSPTGLDAREIEELIRRSLPEIGPETLETLALLIRGRLDEKKRS